MIKDSDGNELTYWPISGLVEGESSDILAFNFVNPSTGVNVALLASNLDARAIVWVRITDTALVISRGGTIIGGGFHHPPGPTPGPWFNISAEPIDLANYVAGTLTFECFIEAMSPITGLNRVPFSVIAGVGGGAAWLYPDEPVPSLGGLGV